MAIIGKVLGIALVIGGLLLWAASALPPLPEFGIDDLPEEPIVEVPLPASDDGYAILTGFVIYDQDREAPVPYIAYDRPQGGMRTKQLVFNDRGCSPAAGDIPCAPGKAAQPQIPEGTNIRVVGIVNGDQIFVERIEGIY